jgi:hypothetical protein
MTDRRPAAEETTQDAGAAGLPPIAIGGPWVEDLERGVEATPPCTPRCSATVSGCRSTTTPAGR